MADYNIYVSLIKKIDKVWLVIILTISLKIKAITDVENVKKIFLFEPVNYCFLNLRKDTSFTAFLSSIFLQNVQRL